LRSAADTGGMLELEEPSFAVVADDLSLDELYAVHSCYPDDDADLTAEPVEVDVALGDPRQPS
jgi:hypothetical protein